MLHFLRQIRQKLIIQENTRKYLLYAVGEILLVVIGILIALQVSNWNQERLERSQLMNYYGRIQDELSDQIIYLEDVKTSIDSLILLNKRNLELFNMNNPDSLFKLEATIGAVGTAWTADYYFPYFEEFIGSEYFSKVQNANIKKQLRDLKARVVDATLSSSFTNTQYQSVIEPYIIKNYNYQNSAMPNYQDFLIPGGPKTDYSKFLNDLEFWNILSLKQENLHQSKERIESVEQSIKKLILILNKELSN